MSGIPTIPDALLEELPEPFRDIDLALPDRREGKVRVSYALGNDQRLLITTDRISAMDRVVGAVPYKGQVLNELSAFWFNRTSDVVPNHLVSVPDPNCMVVHAAAPLPVEVVVRGYLTGVTSTSLWTRYEAGARVIDGHALPDGLHKNAALQRPLITPTTKAQHGAHDEPISVDEVTARGLVAPDVWEQVCTAALALFARGTEIAAASGLILVDTKYEFGLDATGRVMLIDEVHTPDSSRLWVAATLDERRAAGLEPEGLDKEDVRRAVMAHAESATADAALPAEVLHAASARYIDAYQRLCGRAFEPGEYPVAPRIERAVAHLGPLEGTA